MNAKIQQATRRTQLADMQWLVADQTNQVPYAMAVLKGAGVEGRILGRAPIPIAEFGNDKWYARRLADDPCTRPPQANTAREALRMAGVLILDEWIFHERHPKSKWIELREVAEQRLPKPDWPALGSGARKLATEVAQGAKSFAAVAKPRVADGLKASGEGLQRFAVAAKPHVIASTKVAAQATVVAVTLLVPIMLTALVAAASAVATVDPVWTILLPAEDGGDPVWIEIARWDEE